ncbi:hypothetical protein SNA_16425 [Streptomyces natalensis ATCC 27448]|uniref:OmpR/PhoB-type domain-containing protein n=1 Tax=Streptomyces natalensis ATCC 27448 TaxID=1240678 RepID=A0A0D7CMF6_9ACTN|nr:hypothetical protein SNA_16425 [Streptomyces natalensis ATCC 27448]
MRDGIPRLLVIEGDASPPVPSDPYEDWVRPPISRLDLQARVATLRSRLIDGNVPSIDSVGRLSFGSRAVTVSSTQVQLMELFVARFREVVHRDELWQRLTEHSVGVPTRNSLDLHIRRLRQRIAIVKLSLETVRGRGYLLQPCSTVV